MNQRKAEEHRRRLLSEEQDRIKERLEHHDQKLSQSCARNQEVLFHKVETVRRRNQSLSEKLSSYRIAEQEDREKQLRDASEKEKSVTSRIRDVYREADKQWQEFKHSRMEAFEFNRSRQGDNDQTFKQRTRNIMLRLKRSQKHVEEFMRAQNHEFMLKQELRRLKGEDIMKVKMRAKRLEEKKKVDIMKKEADDENLRREIRDGEKFPFETRHSNMMRNNQDKISHIENLEKWVRSGFSTSRTTRQKVNLNQSPELEKRAREAASPVKLRDFQAEGAE